LISFFFYHSRFTFSYFLLPFLSSRFHAENGGFDFESLIPNPIGVIANFFKKGLTENGGINFKRLIPKPYRRDQPAQRLKASFNVYFL
jgi:hypothetical protein